MEIFIPPPSHSLVRKHRENDRGIHTDALAAASMCPRTLLAVKTQQEVTLTPQRLLGAGIHIHEKPS